MTPTEHEGTVAVDAAAKVMYARNIAAMEPIVEQLRAQGQQVDLTRDWDDLGPLEKNNYREMALPVVWAALEALPDRVESLREEFGRRIKDDSLGNGHMKGHVSSLYGSKEAANEGIAGGNGIFADQEIVVRRVTEWEAV